MRVISVFAVMVFMCSSVWAVSGVSPASYEVDFEPGYSGEFVFDFVMGGKASASLYVEGDLAEYVSLDRRSVSGMEEVVVSLDLPLGIDSPGVNYIKIIAGNVMGVIKVNVPYPARYVEVGLNAPNANVGEDVLFEVELFGKGNNTVVVDPRIEVYEGDEVIEFIDVDKVRVFPGDKISVNVSLDTRSYSSGDYVAVAYVDYDDVSVSVENPFRLGKFSVGVVDYTKSFRENKIERFDILVESLWDDDIGEVYAEVKISGSEGLITSSEVLPAWGRKLLVGFLDMSEIEGSSFEAEIILHYGDENVSEVVVLRVVKGVDYVPWAISLVVVIVVVFLIWRCGLFLERCKKHKIK